MVIFLPFAVIFPIIAPMSQAQAYFTKAGAYQGDRQIVRVEKAITAEELPVKPDFVNFSKGRVFLCELCNTDLDRHRDKFTVPVLEKFANDTKSGNGRVLLFDHDRSNPIGRVFGGYLMGEKLMGYAYIHNAMALPKQPGVKIADAVEDRILTDVSVGFMGHIRSAKQDVNGSTLEWEWWMPADGENVTELNELSVVSIGAQPLAGFKSLDGPDQKANSKTVNMSATKSLNIGGKEISGLDLLVRAAVVDVAPVAQRRRHVLRLRHGVEDREHLAQEGRVGAVVDGGDAAQHLVDGGVVVLLAGQDLVADACLVDAHHGQEVAHVHHVVVGGRGVLHLGVHRVDQVARRLLFWRRGRRQLQR